MENKTDSLTIDTKLGKLTAVAIRDPYFPNIKIQLNGVTMVMVEAQQVEGRYTKITDLSTTMYYDPEIGENKHSLHIFPKFGFPERIQ